jgi:hypothetical protein
MYSINITYNSSYICFSHDYGHASLKANIGVGVIWILWPVIKELCGAKFERFKSPRIEKNLKSRKEKARV